MTRRHFKAEIWVVLGLSLGQSAVYAVVSLIAKLTSGGLRNSTATLNSSRHSREYLDLTLQLLGIGFSLAPVALALYLLWMDGPSPLKRLGIDGSRPTRDLVWGAGLAALIGLPGLGVYALGRALGVTAEIIPAPALDYWWTAPILILAAVQNAIVEEVIVVGFLMTRLRALNWQIPSVIVGSAAVRASYHLYQGLGQGLGNFVMGLIFGYWFHRTGRVMPLIIAHTLLDVVAFVGYLWFGDALGITS